MKKWVLGLTLLIQASASFAGLSAAGEAKKQELLSLTNKQLYDKALERYKFDGDSAGWSGVGACYYSLATSCSSCACESYSATNYPNPTNYNGLPFSDTVPGTGCMAWKGSTTPICWDATWSTNGLCVSNMVDAVANQMRYALNSTGNGGDVCKLDRFLQLQSPPKGGMLSDLGESKIKFITNGNTPVISMSDANFNPGLCKMMVKIQGVDALVSLKERVCKGLAKRFRAAAQGNGAVSPNFGNANDLALPIAIGNLSPAIIADIAAQAHAAYNSNIISAIDANFLVKINKIKNSSGQLVAGSYTPSQIAAADIQIADLQSKIQTPPESYIGAALIKYVAPTNPLGESYSPSTASSSLDLTKSIVTSASTCNASGVCTLSSTSASSSTLSGATRDTASTSTSPTMQQLQ